jgi:hypothetical protein
MDRHEQNRYASSSHRGADTGVTSPFKFFDKDEAKAKSSNR